MLRRYGLGAAFAVFVAAVASSAVAEPYLVADFETGDVLMQGDATEPWYPASTTKLMTVYVALNAVREGRLTLDTPLTMSHRAARMPPSKMGFRPGTLVTLDNALKMLMVKSPNDVAWMIAESLDGTVEKFAAEMNATAARLGMRESHFVNPNGLHDDDHYSSARDMAVLARALLKEFPDQADLYDIGSLQFGRQIIRNHNGLLGRYPGADGMKTGFTCPAGWNVVATASRGGRKLIVVVFGAPTPNLRNNEAEMLFDRGFAAGSTGAKLDQLGASNVTAPPNMREQICRGHGKAQAIALEEEFVASAMAEGAASFTSGRSAAPLIGNVMQPPPPAAEPAAEKVAFNPVPVFTGPKPGWTGPVLAATDDVADPAPSPVSAYADRGARADVNAAAPLVLKRVVKPAPRLAVTPQARARMVAAAAREAQTRKAAAVVARKPHPH